MYRPEEHRIGGEVYRPEKRRIGGKVYRPEEGCGGAKCLTERNQLSSPDDDCADAERDAEIRRRLQQGESYGLISTEMRISRTTIAAIAKEMKRDW